MLSFDWERTAVRIHDSELLSFLSDIYRESRYLEAIPDDKLKDRFHCSIANLMIIDNRGIANLRISNGKEGLAFIDVFEEMKIRKIDTDQILYNYLNGFTGLFHERDITLIQRRLVNLRGKKCLFKFTKTKYADAILNGAIRFKTASSYNDAGFNISIRDDELNIEHILHGLRIETGDGMIMPVKGNQITASAAGDYYVCCFTAAFDLKLFALFGCDCCVIISNGERFVGSVIERYRVTHPGYNIAFGAVEYVDPYRQLLSKHPIEFRKSCNFSYEKEYRFVSFPGGRERNIEKEQILSINPGQIEFSIIRMK